MYVLPFECVLVYNSLAICLPKVAKKPFKWAMCKSLASGQVCTLCKCAIVHYEHGHVENDFNSGHWAGSWRSFGWSEDKQGLD